MEIQCECGKFRAELTQFPENTPGRLICYCSDCQAFLNYLKRSDLLDQNGGSEIIPAYPADLKIKTGQEQISCVRLSPTGMFRYFAKCCHTPIANTDPVRPWLGIHRRMYTVKDPNILDHSLGPIKSRIMGKDGKGDLPAGTPKKMDFKAVRTVLPFILKGLLKRKAKPSAFYEDGQSIVIPVILSSEQRLKI